MLVVRMKWQSIFIGLSICLQILPAVAEQSCGAAWGLKTADFEGEVYGSTGFETHAGPNTFALVPAPFGWRIAVRDAAGQDLPVFTPPLRPVGNSPLDIAGWHFRNRDNSGPNRGELNAPQMIRKFTFGRYATDPTRNPELIVPSVMPAEGDQGHGEVIIEDYGLADLEAGQRARLRILVQSPVTAVTDKGHPPSPRVVSAAYNRPRRCSPP